MEVVSYSMYESSTGNAEAKLIGNFEIKDSKVVYPTKKDKLALNEFFPEGPVNQNIAWQLNKYLNGHSETYFLKEN